MYSVSEKVLEEYDKFCEKFNKFDIAAFNSNNYENCLGENWMDEESWKNSEQLRLAFGLWMNRNFKDMKLDCGFELKTLVVYQEIYHRETNANPD